MGRRRTIKSAHQEGAQEKHDEVEEFLARLHTSGNIDEVFTKESYWFAVVLFRKFIRDGAKIVVDMNTGYVGTLVFGKVYDITGDITNKSDNWVDKSLVSDNYNFT